MRAAASLALLLVLTGCPAPSCGARERMAFGRCVPLDGGPLDAPPAPGDAFTGGDVPGEDAFLEDAADAPTFDAPDAAVFDPGPPDFPEVIDHLSFAVRTGPGPNDGTNDNTLSLCLNASACYRMNVADVDDFRIGEMDVYHVDGAALPRSAVDRVELRSVGGVDAWRVACVEVRFDGEPVHCAEALRLLGNGTATGESETYRDPLGLHAACTTCYPSTLTHGPMVGAVTESGARIFVRTDATRRVALYLRDEALPAARWLAAVAYPSPDDDFTATLEASGLTPSHAYTYEIEVDGVLAPRSGRFETAPRTGDGSAFRVVLGSCARLWDQPIFGPIAAASPELFVFLGDNHYANSPDLESLWWFYRRALEVPQRGALARTTSTLAIWDDHDFVGNNTDRTSPGRDAALRAFGDYWAQPAGGIAGQPGIFTRVVRGDVDFFLLDDRYQRDPPGTAGGRILGAMQEAWLIDELSRSTATFHFLASGSIFSLTRRRDLARVSGLARRALRRDRAGGHRRGDPALGRHPPQPPPPHPPPELRDPRGGELAAREHEFDLLGPRRGRERNLLRRLRPLLRHPRRRHDARGPEGDRPHPRRVRPRARRDDGPPLRARVSRGEAGGEALEVDRCASQWT
jgi:alkaline phosphatase D